MAQSLAILTGQVQDQPWPPSALQHLDAFQTRIVIDQPDLPFRALSSADVVVLGSDVDRSRAMQVLRAFSQIGVSSPVLAVVPPHEPVESVLGFFAGGASAVVIDAEEPGELNRAVRQVMSGRMYLSSGLIPAVLERYRDLCADLRSRMEGRLVPSRVCSRRD